MTEYAKLPPVTFEVRPIEDYEVVISSNYTSVYKDKDGNLVRVWLNEQTISFCPASESHEVIGEDGHYYGKNFKINRKINKRNPNEKKLIKNTKHNGEEFLSTPCLII